MLYYKHCKKFNKVFNMTEHEINAYIMIRRKLAVSRADVARCLGISRPTASLVCESLLAKNLIQECGKGKSTGGTTPTLLRAASSQFNIIGIDFGYSNKMTAVLLDGAGNITDEKEAIFLPDDIDSIYQCAQILVQQLAGNKKIDGIALALSAIIDERSREVLKSVNTLFCNKNFLPSLKKIFPYPLFISNRSRSAAISEAFGGAADKVNDFALISLGKSVGGAFWCNGGLFSGTTSSAGEIRNLRISDGTRLEDLLSKENIERISRERFVNGCAEALNLITDIMDFKLLVLSGRFADFGVDFAPLLQAKLCNNNVTVKQSRFGRFSAARGSAFQMAEFLIKNNNSN